MDSFGQLSAVVLVLGLLGVGLWGLRRMGIAKIGMSGGGRGRSLRVVERLALTPQHSLHLVQVADRTMLIATSPAGCAILANDAARQGAEIR